jgi:hypothetical protein
MTQLRDTLLLTLVALVTVIACYRWAEWAQPRCDVRAVLAGERGSGPGC